MTGTDLLLARRKAKVSTAAVARRMGVSRQYVSKLEAAEVVTAEAEARYRAALAESIEDPAELVVYPASTNDYAAAAKVARALARKDPNVLFTVLLTSETTPIGLLATVDVFAALGRRSRVVVDGDEPLELRRA